MNRGGECHGNRKCSGPPVQSRITEPRVLVGGGSWENLIKIWSGRRGFKSFYLF